MWLKEQLQPQLDDKEIQFVEQRFQQIIHSKSLDNEDWLILNDAISALKCNLFFSSLSTLFAVLETYLRKTLVMYYTKQQKVEITKFMTILEDIEESLEEGKNDYNFYGICDKLKKEGLLSEQLVNELTETYKILRIPVQHGIFWRLIRNTFWKVEIPMVSVSFDENISPEGLMESMLENIQNPVPNTKWSLHNPIVRPFQIMMVCKDYSLVVLDLFVRVVDDIVKHR